MLEIAPSRILFGASAKPSQSALRFQGIGFDSFSDLADEGPDQPVTVAGDALVYIIFTSGTTGTPKGVMIEAESVAQFIEIMHRRFRFGADNRVAEASELTFDASVFDMFMAWSAGAALYVVPAAPAYGAGEVHPRPRADYLVFRTLDCIFYGTNENAEARRISFVALFDLCRRGAVSGYRSGVADRRPQ